MVEEQKAASTSCPTYRSGAVPGQAIPRHRTDALTRSAQLNPTTVLTGVGGGSFSFHKEIFYCAHFDFTSVLWDVCWCG